MPNSSWIDFLLYCAIGNYALLLLSFGLIVIGRDTWYRLHSRWFTFSRERFDTIVYCWLGLYKLGIWFFLIIPCIALTLMD